MCSSGLVTMRAQKHDPNREVLRLEESLEVHAPSLSVVTVREQRVNHHGFYML